MTARPLLTILSVALTFCGAANDPPTLAAEAPIPGNELMHQQSHNGTSIWETGETIIMMGTVSGNIYREWSFATRQAYVLGHCDAIFASSHYTGNVAVVEQFHRCIGEMDSGQVTAVVDKYVEERPAQWHTGMNVLIYAAFRESFGRPQRQ